MVMRRASTDCTLVRLAIGLETARCIDGIFVDGKPALPQMKLMIRLRSAAMPDELRGEVWRTLSSTLICADAVAS
jgi:hypothetical protein